MKDLAVLGNYGHFNVSNKVMTNFGVPAGTTLWFWVNLEKLLDNNVNQSNLAAVVFFFLGKKNPWNIVKKIISNSLPRDVIFVQSGLCVDIGVCE